MLSRIATAMPTIVAELGGARFFSWVFAAYLLTQAVTTPIYGRLADVHGRNPVAVFYNLGTVDASLPHDSRHDPVTN
jgi:MFS family permease